MAKFYGAIGYARLEEESPGNGNFIEKITEKNYRGDILLNQFRTQVGEKVNDDVTIDNSISIIADTYAYANCGHMRYVVWDNIPWKIKSLSVVRPRIILQIGEVYNGERPTVITEQTD